MDILSTILDTKIIAISRGNYGEGLLNAVEALYRAGIRAVEVTFEQHLPIEKTRDAIAQLAKNFSGRMAIGAGTVLKIEQLESAYMAGASYIVSPNVNEKIIKATKKHRLISIPGAMTPTEIASAYDAGADIVKLFPAGILGAEYFKAVKTPFGDIKLAAVGGINPQNLLYFASAGACAFGVSSGLFPKKHILAGEYDAIEDAAKGYISVLNGKQ